MSPKVPIDPASQRGILLAAQAARPADPWPRGTGHVVLALPGSREEEKAYHEPGGAFSPGVCSLGLSLWVRGPGGGLVATADSLPMADIVQRLVHPPGSGVPAIDTTTPHYRVSWQCVEPGRWRGTIEAAAGNAVELVVRSAGPAGGPLRHLRWDGATLVADGRFSIRLSPAPMAAHLGIEGRPGWTSAVGGPTEIADPGDGWCFARLALPAAVVTVEVADGRGASQPELAAMVRPSPLRLDLPERRFADSLLAQADHLLMGLVRDETRPGEPTNYPLTWLRDGAFAVVALARCGQIEVARKLARRFAEHDFFGGFGAEGDGPGLALWCMDEVAALRPDPAFDAWLWPHVQRKTAWIQRMATATREIRLRDFPGAIVPHLLEDPVQVERLGLICEAARDGLVRGRMDLHFPALFTTGASLRGLTGAVRIARRLGHDAEAGSWNALATEMRAAWNRALPGPEGKNERVAMSGLWPFAAVTDQRAFREVMEKHWQGSRDGDGGMLRTPKWTYFTFAEAHQWLLLGHADRVWATLRWFWAHEPSPGLYAWWEGDGEENAFRRWETVRGWTKPPHVVPHYWSAATSLLLHLAMLAHEDGETLVLGDGVPSAWLASPLAVGNLPTPLGVHAWRWDGTSVVVSGPRCPVRLGSAFPAGTRIVWD